MNSKYSPAYKCDLLNRSTPCAFRSRSHNARSCCSYRSYAIVARERLEAMVQLQTCDRACRSHIAPTAMRPIGRLATNPPDLSLMVLWCALYCVCCARRCRLHACSCSILKSGATDAQSSFWMSMIDEDSLCDGTGVLLVAWGHPLRPHQVGIRAGRRAGRSAGMWAGMRVGKGSGRRWMVDAISRRSYYGSTGCGLPYA